MTDINARIDWQPGMQITAQTMREMAESLDYKQRLMNLIANDNRIGLLPGTDFSCHGVFVRNVLEISPLKCRAILPSGRIVDADEDVKIKIPILYGDKYYLTISFGEGEVGYDKEEVAFVRPQYLYEIHTMEEIQKGDYLPLVKFNVSEGMFSINAQYIPPTLLISGNPRFAEFITSFVEKLSQLANHDNMEEGEGKRCLLSYLFRLKSYDPKESTHNFLQLMQEIAQAVDYYVMAPNTGNRNNEYDNISKNDNGQKNTSKIEKPNPSDVEEWLSWMLGYLDGTKSILDGVVLEDNSIDYEKLKQEITADVYERAYQQVYEQLRKEILERFNPDMEQQIREALTSYLNDVMRQEISDALRDELSSSLYDKLYQILYDALYNALHVEEEKVEEVEEYIPQI